MAHDTETSPFRDVVSAIKDKLIAESIRYEMFIFLILPSICWD